MPGPYYYEQVNGTLDIQFEGEHVVLNPGDQRPLPDPCTTVRFVNAVQDAHQAVRDRVPEGLDALQAECTASGGGPGGASPPLEPPPTPPPSTDPGSTDAGAPADGQPETADTLGAPAPQASGTTGKPARDPGRSDGRPLAQQYYAPVNPLTDYDVADLLRDGGTPPGELDAALADVFRNAAPTGAAHPDFGPDNAAHQVTVADPVELFSGQFVLAVTDIEIASRGFPLRLVRYHRSGPVWFGPWGYNWDHCYDVYLRPLADGGVAVWTGELREDVYSPAAAGGFQAPIGGRLQLEFSPAAGIQPDQYLLTDLGGRQQIFSVPDGYPRPDRIPLVQVQDRAGNGHDLAYDAQGRPRSVTDHAGRAIRFDYGDCGLLERVYDDSGRSWHYWHDDQVEHLVRVTGPSTPTFPDGVSTWYQYGDRDSEQPGLRHHLTRVVDPDGREVVDNTYGQDPASDNYARIVEQDVGGFRTTYTTTVLQFVPRTPDAINVPAWRVEVDDPGNLFVYTFNYRGDLLDQRVRLVLDGSLRLVARTYRYDIAGNVIERYDPNGFGCLLTYDHLAADARARGNLLRMELVAPPTAPGPSRVIAVNTYDPRFRRLRTARDENGHDTRFVYDYEETTAIAGDVIRIEYADATLPSGAVQQRHESLSYNAFGQMIEHISGTGAVERFEYFAAGASIGYIRRHTQDATGANQWTEFEYDAAGVPSAFVDALGHRTEHDVDAQGLLLAVRRPMVAGALAQTSYRYLPSGRVSRAERPCGEYADGVLTDAFLATDYGYDEFGLLSTVTYGANTGAPLTYRYDRDPIGNIHRITDPLGRQTRCSYDERWLMLTQTEAFGTPEQATTHYGYDVNGNRTFVTDPAGHRIDLRYDGWDRLAEIRLHGAPDAERTRIRLSLNAFDRAERIRIDGLVGPGVVGPLLDATIDFDERGRAVRRTLGARTAETTYDADERPISVADQRGGTARTDYDGVGRVVRAVDAAGNADELTYDAAGRLTMHERIDQVAGGGTDHFVTAVDHDERDRPVAATDPLGRVTRQRWDDRDLPVAEVDALGGETSRTFGIRGEVLTVTRSLGAAGSAVHRSTWDAGGRLIAYQDPEGAVTRYAFDARDRRISISYPDGSVHRYAYDARIQPQSEITPGGTRRDYSYRDDGALRRVDVTPGPGVAATAPVEVFSDGLRREVWLRQGGEVVERRFDELRLIGEATSGGWVSIGYDDALGVARVGYPDARVDEVAVDLLGRVQRVSLSVPGSGGATGTLPPGTALADFVYRGRERIARRDHWNGWSSNFDYDATARLVGISYTDQHSTPQQHYRDVFDALDRRRARWAEPAPQFGVRAGYDALDRLVNLDEGVALADPGVGLDQAGADAYLAAVTGPAARTQSFTYNLADARLADTDTAGAAHTYQLGPTYAVTAVLTGSPPTGTPHTYDADGRLIADGTCTYTYDGLGRLVEVRAGPVVVLHQEFDPLGRVVRRTQGGATTTRVHLAGRVLEERDAAGNTLRQFAYGPGIDEVVAVSNGANQLPVQDNLQSILAYADDSGAVTERYAFDAFGAARVFAPDGLTVRPAPTAGPVIYAGHPLIGGRWYDARARVYDPDGGRFLQPDPFDYVDSADRYGYTHGDPLGFVDPNGDIALLVGLAVAAGVGLVMGLGSNAVRQDIQLMEGSREDFSFSELLWSGASGAVLGPVLVVAPELAIPLAGMGVASGVKQYQQGHYATGSFDLALAILPFGSKNVRSATFGRGTLLSPAGGLGPIDPIATRWGRIGTMGREFLNPTERVTRATHVSSDAGLQSIKGSNTINPSAGQTGLKALFEGSRSGSWVIPWRASQLRTFSRSMIGLPRRAPYVEFDVQPGELGRAGGIKSRFSRWQRQTPGPIDLTGRNPTFGVLGDVPTSPMLVDIVPFMHLTIPGDRSSGGSGAGSGPSSAARTTSPQRQK